MQMVRLGRSLDLPAACERLPNTGFLPGETPFHPPNRNDLQMRDGLPLEFRCGSCENVRPSHNLVPMDGKCSRPNQWFADFQGVRPNFRLV